MIKKTTAVRIITCLKGLKYSFEVLEIKTWNTLIQKKHLLGVSHITHRENKVCTEDRCLLWKFPIISQWSCMKFKLTSKRFSTALEYCNIKSLDRSSNIVTHWYWYRVTQNQLTESLSTQFLISDAHMSLLFDLKKINM